MSMEALEKIMAAYLPHQQEIIQSLVHPIGEMPCGQSFTGFWMEEQGKAHHIREKRNMVHAKLCMMKSKEIFPYYMYFNWLIVWN